MIELLVVISIIALLMAILLPTLGRVRNQARDMGCQAKLRQWGVIFQTEMTARTEGAVSEDLWKTFRYGFSIPDGVDWERASRVPLDLFVCPMASRPSPNKLPWQSPEKPGGTGSTFFATWRTEPDGRILRLSYGIGGGFTRTTAFGGPEGMYRFLNNLKGSACASFPVLFDCAQPIATGTHLDGPPPYEDAPMGTSPGDWHALCLNRHHGGVNYLFLDWSVRKVGLKELWTLKWWEDFDTRGPWTKRGGVQPEDWPVWMRKFKDY